MKRADTRTPHSHSDMSFEPAEKRPMRDKVSIKTTNDAADLDRRLDLALEETFPASDPVSVMCN